MPVQRKLLARLKSQIERELVLNSYENVVTPNKERVKAYIQGLFELTTFGWRGESQYYSGGEDGDGIYTLVRYPKPDVRVEVETPQPTAKSKHIVFKITVLVHNGGEPNGLWYMLDKGTPDRVGFPHGSLAFYNVNYQRTANFDAYSPVQPFRGYDDKPFSYRPGTIRQNGIEARNFTAKIVERIKNEIDGVVGQDVDVVIKAGL